MKPTYHFHITVDISNSSRESIKRFAKEHKCKVTIIELYNSDKVQTDIMLTRYGNDYQMLYDIGQDIMKELSNTDMIPRRLKVEQLLSERPTEFIPSHYMEYHVKVEDKDLLPIDGFVMSRNPREDNTRFFNARIYNECDFDIVDNSLNTIDNIISAHYEITKYDSNLEHDRWWA